MWVLTVVLLSSIGTVQGGTALTNFQMGYNTEQDCQAVKNTFKEPMVGSDRHGSDVTVIAAFCRPGFIK